ncbi:MAG TPA: FAD-binding oxidoreductase, partial [Pseudomonas sp.]|nr:FAD-binding oxidoreductase [Pseudomonas sp.]
ELDQGYILACQSVPQTDIRIAVELAGAQAPRRVSGRILAQEKLTHDITRLTVQLEQSLAYKSGQFANISLESLPGLSRSYSFASRVQPDAKVSFFVRKVPEGRFSSAINDDGLIGQRMSIEGPLGDFWLRPAEAPLLLVAGGSGLAPLLAVLQEVVASGVSRSATLLFGAREERDLYALDEIRAIAAQWRGQFRSVPVLSAVTPDAGWSGECGLVTERIASLLEPGTHAYLCGPPGMIDSAVAVLREHGVAPEHIHADRFTTQAASA